MALIIKNGTIVTAKDTYQGDLLINGERIELIGLNIPTAENDTVIDATGKYVFPGGVDVHTHFELPFMGTVSADDFETGSRAAICGGTTTFIDFVIPEKGKPLQQGLQSWKQKAAKAVADYGFHMAIVEYTAAVAEEIPAIIEQGITSFKCFMAYKNVFQVDDGQLLAVLKNAGQHGGLVSVHAENGDIIAMLTQQFLKENKVTPKYHWRAHPAIAEAEAVERAITLADFIGQPIYIVHLSSADGLEKVKAAVARGAHVIAETCPQYLLLHSDLYCQPGFEGAKYVMSPPIRPKDHLEKLWAGINKGYIQVVATDHCPFNFSGQKDMGEGDFSRIPNGIPAVGDRFNLLYTYGVVQKRISLNRFVDVVATAPAKIFGLYPKKGSIVVGGDADLVIFDPKATAKITAEHQNHNVDYSAFEGFALKGLPHTVLLRGKVAVREGIYVGEPGGGKFIPRTASGKEM
ncbi:dihydropyrimidinase [candidate division CSSED10-310 bacterium]|uniref:Dihydropyrimidinase n=1 Tax=candidate division CSSED10-310 bacterium TaxID=2855610 RepID=A0ABV6YTJ7_UNCC1